MRRMQRTRLSVSPMTRATAAVPSGELSSTKMTSQSQSTGRCERRSKRTVILARSLNVGTTMLSSGAGCTAVIVSPAARAAGKRADTKASIVDQNSYSFLSVAHPPPAIQDRLLISITEARRALRKEGRISRPGRDEARLLRAPSAAIFRLDDRGAMVGSFSACCTSAARMSLRRKGDEFLQPHSFPSPGGED